MGQPYNPWYKSIPFIPKEDDFDFKLKRDVNCSCGRRYCFFSQPDDSPEIYTFITLNCVCGGLIKMKFPVN